SFVSKNKGRIIWKFVRETGNGKAIPVPRRIMRGFRNSEVESFAFTFFVNNGEVSVADLDEMYEWSVSTDTGASFIDIYGRTVIPIECIMKGIDKKSGEMVLIEVSKI